jgi:hypothetical protein
MHISPQRHFKPAPDTKEALKPRKEKKIDLK